MLDMMAGRLEPRSSPELHILGVLLDKMVPDTTTEVGCIEQEPQSEDCMEPVVDYNELELLAECMTVELDTTVIKTRKFRSFKRF